MMASSYESGWVSEHLSFNAFWADDWTSAGFLLPPLQCQQTVGVAARKLRALAHILD
jgi:hypothetical protein